jgi:hypothetical protein
MSALPLIADIGEDGSLVRSMPGSNNCGQSSHACARTHEHRAGSLCTKSSNNNNGGFSGFLKVGVGVISLKFSAKEGPISLGAFTRGAAVFSAFDWLSLLQRSLSDTG